jgi:very-short-patch-repair endonuclease
MNWEDRAELDAIPVTSVARTLFDLAEVVGQDALEHAFEEADRLGLLELLALERICEHSHGRRALLPAQRLIAEARAATMTRSPLEDRFAALCRTWRLPTPSFNVQVLGFEVDALWPAARLIVELDGFAYHHHRAAFERDRARDAALQAAGYRVVRLTHRRLERDPPGIEAEIRRLLLWTAQI